MRLAGVNLVEIDLLRRGAHATAAPVTEIRRRVGPHDYHVCITRADRDDAFFVIPIRLQNPLPVIDVPLTAEAGTVPVNLQEALNRTYDEALYERRVRYGQPCDPALTPEQQTWANAILREKGLIK